MITPNFVFTPHYHNDLPVNNLWVNRHELRGELEEILSKAEIATQYHSIITMQE